MSGPAPQHVGIRSLAAPLGGALLILLAAACGSRAPVVEMVDGACSPVHGADVCTWGETTNGAVTAFGATVPISAIENAPPDAAMTFPPMAAATIALPASVAASTGFQTLTIFWEPHGHPPGPYLTPHFDFHFYSLSATEINAIDCSDSSKPAQAPAAYALPDVAIPGMGELVGLCIPMMGMHAVSAAELASEAVFEKTMVVGYYSGAPIFVEPMLTRATLMQRQGFTLEMPEVPGRPSTARYPMKFRADYDSTAQAYRFVFSELEAAKTTM